MKSQNIEDLMIDNFMPYSAHLVFHRALPLIDGFKPSQRRILYTMYNNGMTHNKAYTKCNSISGDVMKIHPHGSTYDTLVRMSEGNEAFGVPFIDSKGNFGKIYSRDSKQASERYTDARLNKLASELFAGINKDAVKMVETYDEKDKEPSLLPVPFPTILTNGISGMAVGMATDFPIFNYHEVLNYTISILKGRDGNIIDYIPAPDFPTLNSIVYDVDEMSKIMETGRGSFKIRAQYKIEDNTIHFIHVPYTTRYEVILDQISELAKEGKLKEVVDAHDLYGMNSTGIQIIAKKSTDMNKLVEKLFSLTRLEDTYSVNLNLVINNVPQVLGVTNIIKEWIKFRKVTLNRIHRFKLEENLITLERLMGLKNICDSLDKVVKLIRKTKSNVLTTSLQTEFNLTENQALYIQNIQLRNLSEDYITKRLLEIDDLVEKNEVLNDLLENDSSLNQYIINQLTKMNSDYSFPRCTTLVNKADVLQKAEKLLEPLNAVEDYNIKLFITEEGYAKKMSLTSLRSMTANRIREGDSIIKEIETTNNSDILVFTDKHNVYKYKAHEMENHRPSVLGEYMPSLLELKDENIVHITATNDYKGYLLIGFTDGKVAKIDMKAYYTKQNRSLLIKAYAEKDAIYFKHIDEDEQVDLFMISSINKALVYDVNNINSKASRASIGVQVMRLKDDEVVSVISDKLDDVDVEYYKIAGAGRGKNLK